MRTLLEITFVDITAVVTDSVGYIEGKVVATFLGGHLEQLHVLLLGEMLLKVHMQSRSAGEVLDVGGTVQAELVEYRQRGVLDNIEI